MNIKEKGAKSLVALGAAILVASAFFHLMDYGKDMVNVSTLSAHMREIFAALYLLAGWNWIVVAVIALLAAFSEARTSRVILMSCGLAVLVEGALMLFSMGLFLGTRLMGLAAISFIGGGLMLRRSPTTE